MKRNGVLIFALFMIVTVTSVSTFGSTMGTVFPGTPEMQQLRWKNRTIKIAVSRSITEASFNIKTGSDTLGAIRRSLQAWQAVADIELLLEPSELQSVSPSGMVGDGISLLTIAQTPENVLFFANDPGAESAKTRVFYNRRGFITEADIVLNPLQQFSTDGTFGTFDLESALTHEIGHLLGLRHAGVLGATMSETLPTNGMFGFADFGFRSLAETDISAIRELYGVKTGDETCCAAITGKLSLEMARPTRNLRVWAENNETGQVIAQVDVASDGSFRIGGMPQGAYALFWQKKDTSASAIGSLGLVKLESGESRVLNDKIVSRRSDVALSYVGINRQLVGSAVALGAGREYLIFLGGANLDPERLNIDFNSPYFRVSRSTMTREDFGKNISAVSFIVTVDPNTPTGVYSIFASDQQGVLAALIGALNVE